MCNKISLLPMYSVFCCGKKMKAVHISLASVSVLCVAAIALPNSPAKAGVAELHMTLRTWVHPFKNSPEWTPARFEQTIPANRTAIIICDMWDKHWCNGATTRVEGLA